MGRSKASLYLFFNSVSKNSSLSLTVAGFASLAVGHMVEYVLHGAAVGQGAGPHLPVGLLPPLALVCMQQQDQLLLNEFSLLRVGRWACGHTTGSRDH